MKKRVALTTTIALSMLLVFQAVPMKSAANDCSASDHGEITPLSSLTINFTCSADTTVYFAVCDSGREPDDLFNITYMGGVVAYNAYSNSVELLSIGQANVSAGAQIATLNSLTDTSDPPATYAYAISSDLSQVNEYLGFWCGGDLAGQRSGSIRGLVFHDTNRNGVRDTGEKGFAGANVTLYSAGDWWHTFTTGADGTYAPVALGTSYYSVELTVPQGYVPTGPTRHEAIWIDGTAGTAVLGKDFGIAPAASPIDAPGSVAYKHVGHTVRPGEWLYKIARAYNVNVWAIVEANHLTSLQLYPGQRLIIPGVPSWSTPVATPPAPTGCRFTYVVRPGDNLFRIALHNNIPYQTVAARNGIGYPFTIYVGQVLCIP